MPPVVDKFGYVLKCLRSKKNLHPLALQRAVSAAAIPNWLELSLAVQVRVDFWDANVAELTLPL